MMFSGALSPLTFKWHDLKMYVFSFLFIAGNILLPQLCHQLPQGGQMLMPIYFFTLIASYKFGWKVGFITALCSPVFNSVLFGMPPLAALPVILIKSTLLALVAGWVAVHFKKISLPLLLLVILGYQIPGSLIEWAITKSLAAAIQDITIGIPGMFLQLIGGWFLLKKLAGYES
jgi:hypothetical protein